MSDQQPAPGGGELTQFESLSAITPKKQPMAILIGAGVLLVALWLLNVLAPTEAVEELRTKGEKQTAAETAGATGQMDRGAASGIDDI